MSNRQIVLDLPEDTYAALKHAAAETKQTETEVAVAALEAFLGTSDPLLGLFADEPALLDDIVAEAMQNRQDMPLRIKEHHNEQGTT